MRTDFVSRFEELLNPDERRIIAGLDKPFKISQFLDTVRYPSGDRNRSVLNVLREREAHCLDGGLFAAAMLSRIGFPAVIIDLHPEPGTDDDHVLAVFRQNNGWGCVAKSNFAGLRYRDPIYRSLRELVMSYFEVYFNANGQKTLRGYSRPIRLDSFRRHNWLVEDGGVDDIEMHLEHFKSYPLITPDMAASLSPVDQRSKDAGMLGVNPDGLYKG
jgi:hypothetical protein